MNDEKLAETPPRQDEERDAALESALRTSPTWSNHSQDLSKETGEPQVNPSSFHPLMTLALSYCMS